MSWNGNDVMILRTKIKSLEEHGVIANTSVLETEKERDKLHKELELTGDTHEIHTEVDEWDLRDFLMTRHYALTRGVAYRLTKCGQLRWSLTCVLDTFGSASLGQFLVA